MQDITESRRRWDCGMCHRWESVSYTHLDVYKRQAVSIDNRHFVLCQSTGLVGADNLRAAERFNRRQFTDEDVYKRQLEILLLSAPSAESLNGFSCSLDLMIRSSPLNSSLTKVS